MNELPYVVFDLDDTLANLRHRIHESLTLTTGKNVPIETWASYDIMDYFGINHAQFLDIIRTHQCLEHCHPEPFAHDTVHAMRREGYAIGVMTARGWHPEGEAITRTWLGAHNIPVDKIAVVSHAPKGESIHTHFDNAVAFIDDHPKHVASVEAAGIPAWLMIRPWGKNFDYPRRIECLSEFADEVKTMQSMSSKLII